MDVLVERVAGLDVGKDVVVVCVRTPGDGGRRVSETRIYRTMSRSLEAMADWLVEQGVTLAGQSRLSTLAISATSDYRTSRSEAQHDPQFTLDGSVLLRGEFTIGLGPRTCPPMSGWPLPRLAWTGRSRRRPVGPRPRVRLTSPVPVRPLVALGPW
jgi:hypothetical protein